MLAYCRPLDRLAELFIHVYIFHIYCQTERLDQKGTVKTRNICCFSKSFDDDGPVIYIEYYRIVEKANAHEFYNPLRGDCIFQYLTEF